MNSQRLNVEATHPVCRFGWLIILILAVLPFCRPAPAQQYSVQAAYNILTQNDHSGACDPQAGAFYPFVFNIGCCGSPGFRVCPFILHGGKGSWGISAGCTDPDGNQVNGDACELPTPPPIPRNVLPPARPIPAGTSIDFLVTSDLHFYRVTYNVMDQVSHPSAMMAFSLEDSVNQSGAQPVSKYGAILVAGDMSTGANDGGYFNQDDRISAYRMMWENNWPSQSGYLPGASAGLPVFPTLGNHDFNDTTWWSYMNNLTLNLNRDGNSTGCLESYTTGCLDQYGQAGTLNYSFDWEGVHFLMLNTWAGDVNPASPGGSDGLTWLKNDLQTNVAASGKPVIIVQHYGLDDADVTGGPLTDTNGAKVWWTSAQKQSFENVIQPYNVIGWFSGHTHDLGMHQVLNTININSNNYEDGSRVKFGETLDNFDDGAGGDCGAHGVGAVFNPPSDWEQATYCSHATKNFLAVHVDEQYMRVRAISYSDLEPFYADKTIGMVGESATDASSCNKWIGGGFQDITNSAQISVDGNNLATVSNTGNTSLAGALALWVEGSDLSQWDFVDSCSSYAHKFVYLTSGSLKSGQHLTAQMAGPKNIPAADLHLIRLQPQFVADPPQPSIGITPTTITISSNTGAPISFKVAVDGGGASYTTQWLIATAGSSSQSFNSNTIFTTPQTFNLSAPNINYEGVGQLFQNIYVTDTSGKATPLNIYMPLAAPVLNMITNATGAQASVYTSTVGLPTSYTGEPHGGEQVPVSVTSPQFPSVGTRLVFQRWSDGGASSHTITLGCCGAPSTLAANFETDYLVTPTVSAGGTLTINPQSPDGYYKTGVSLKINAKADPNYYFVGYTGQIATNQANINEPLQGPVSFTATFAPQPQITFSSNVPAGLGSQIDIQSQSQAMPFTEGLVPGTTVVVTAPASFISSANFGIQYVFQNWSDGVTSATRSIVVPAANTTYTAMYVTQILVTVTANPVAGGTVTGGGWYALASSVTLTASAASGDYFAGFVGTSGFGGTVSSGSTPWNFSGVIAPLNITANFLPLPQVTVTSSPSNQVIYIDNVAYLTPHVFTWLPGDKHSVDATKTNPPAGTRLNFTGWSDTGAALHQVTVPGVNETLAASFTTSYQLSVTTSGAGAVTANPASPTNDGYYPAFASVALTAVPAAGNYFAGFGGLLTGVANPQGVTMSAPLTVSASFAGLPQVTVGVSGVNDLDPNTVQLNLVLNNTGQGPATGLSILLLTASDLTGTGVVGVAGLPGPVTVLAGQSSIVPLSIAWPSTAKRVQLKVQFIANGGSYSGSQTLTLFR